MSWLLLLFSFPLLMGHLIFFFWVCDFFIGKHFQWVRMLVFLDLSTMQLGGIVQISPHIVDILYIFTSIYTLFIVNLHVYYRFFAWVPNKYWIACVTYRFIQSFLFFMHDSLRNSLQHNLYSASDGAWMCTCSLLTFHWWYEIRYPWNLLLVSIVAL